MSSVPNPFDAVNTSSSQNQQLISSGSQTNGPAIIVSIGTEHWHLNSNDLIEGHQASLLLDQVGIVNSPPVVILDRLFALSPAAQLSAVNLIRVVEQRCTSRQTPANGSNVGGVVTDNRDRGIQCRVGSDSQTDPFAAILSALPRDLGVASQFDARQTSLEAVRIWHSATPKFACQMVQLRFDECGYCRPNLRELERDLRAIHDAQTDETIEQLLIRICDVFPDAGVPEDLVIPTGWAMSINGISHDGVEHIPAPVLIESRLRQHPSGIELVSLQFLRDGQWQRRVVKRAEIASSREIVALAGFGLPVTSNNASALVQYLSDFEAANNDVLIPAIALQQFGWYEVNGVTGFLIGHDSLQASQGNATSDQRPQIVRFDGSDGANDQIAQGFREKGSLEGWLAAIRPLAEFPRVKLAIYTSLAPPLLRILDAQNVCIDFSGTTSQGKTFTLRTAGSVWGAPAEDRSESSVGTWYSTRTFVERRAAIGNDLPLLLDDTKRASSNEFVAQTVYDIASGRAKGRGTVDGIATTQCYRTILMSTGEQPLTSFSCDGGTRARAFLLWGSPFGRTDQAISSLIANVNTGIREHYGTAGRAFVQCLLDGRISFETLRQIYHERIRHYERRAGNDAVKCRMAQSLALIDVATMAAHVAIDFPWPIQYLADELYDDLTSDTPDADRASVALAYVDSWASSHRDDFHSRCLSNPHRQSPPADGWAGYWEQGNDWEYIAFYPSRLDAILEKAGFEAAAIIRTWKDRGLLRTNAGRNQLRIRLASGASPTFIAINRSAFEQISGDPADDESCFSVSSRTA